MKELLEAGVHFGHQTRRWNPKMRRYIYGGRGGIYIIDLHQTLKLFDEAQKFVREVAESGQPILFVGTKKQAQDAVQEAATRCGQYYVNQRWLGGMLTNYETIKRRIGRLRELEQMQGDGTLERLPKKEALGLLDEKGKLERFFNGIKDMPGLPGCVFIVDLKKEHIAVAEARKLEIPIIAIVDTNCDPDEVDYVIPGNDDAIRAVKLIANRLADAVIEGRPDLAQATEEALVHIPEGEEAVEEALKTPEEIQAARSAEASEEGFEEAVEFEGLEQEIPISLEAEDKA
jgi:small subunit ribosomal protein S2